MESDPVISKLIQKVGFEQFVTDGNEAVKFKLIRTTEDLHDESLVFHPEMCHQIFGEGETIFGYENLQVQVYFTAGSLKTFIGTKYTRKVNPTMADGVEADNIVEKLETVIPSGYTSNIDDFSGCVEKETSSFYPIGDLIHSFQKVWNHRHKEGSDVNMSKNSNGHSMERTFEIFVTDGNVTKFSEYLKNMESFTLWFIDAASLLDPTDERWKFYTMFEKYRTSEGNKSYAFVGYSAVYEFYSYPDKMRPRVAQMLILPPFQKQGLAVELLSAIYNAYRTDTRVLEITVEDPSDDFEGLRDFVDSRDCMGLTSFAPDKLKLGFIDEMEEEAKKRLKMTKRQARRVYEILRLRVTNVNDEVEFKKFRLSVKERLNIPYKKQESDIKRMMRRQFNTTELQKVTQMDDASRKIELESNFQNLYTHYKTILHRLDRYTPC